KELFLAITKRPGTWASSVMMDSVIPSLKYSFVLSLFTSTNGRTAMDFPDVSYLTRGWLRSVKKFFKKNPAIKRTAIIMDTDKIFPVGLILWPIRAGAIVTPPAITW